ncbi:protein DETOXIFICATION 45, chloroplastic-like [Phalaenopsis equestris]|uniref:protein DETOXIFICATION 45, chloroplastic-like n=1 Tax=Phalaenopsis equestris TaxID=78828 RepID=UPI0009E41774|nr:protein DETOXIFICATION 45, chloroplastic-like [Phalaenopsis equestris]
MQDEAGDSDTPQTFRCAKQALRQGSVELAAAGVSVSIFNIISKLFNIPLLSVTTSFVAEEISKNSNKASQEGFLANKKTTHNIVEKLELPSVSTALLLAAVIGAVEALALFMGTGAFLNMMGISPVSPMHRPAQQFLSLRALGAPAVVVSLAIQGIFRGFKDTKTPLFCVGFGNISSIILLPLLAYSFGLGITGAAIATVASQYITAFLLVWSLSRRAVVLTPRIQKLQFGGYVKSGGFLLGRTLSVLISMTLGTSMAARLGPLAMASASDMRDTANHICKQI